MATWVRDSSGNLVNLDKYNQVVIERSESLTGSGVYVNSPDEMRLLIQGPYDDCKRYYDGILSYLGFNIYVAGNFVPGKGGNRQ